MISPKSRSNLELTLTKEEVSHYCHINYKLISLHCIASDDYIAFRCCYLNEMLDQAYVFAEQAIEKELKFILLVLNPTENMNKYKNHKIESIIQRIQCFQDFELTKFQELGVRLSELYEYFRYPDNYSNLLKKEKRLSFGGDEINLIDEFFFHLIDRWPLKEEILFRIGLMATIFENSFIKQPRYFATHRNQSLNKRHENLSLRFHKVRKHLYPALY